MADVAAGLEAAVKARLMSDVYLRVHRHKLPDWPSSALGGPGDLRGAYLVALKKADGGDFGPLVEYTKKFLPKEGTCQ